jgi:hypothetical protein
LPDIDPEASNTIIASSVQGERSSWPVVARPPKAGTAAAAKATATLQERVERCIGEILPIWIGLGGLVEGGKIYLATAMRR